MINRPPTNAERLQTCRVNAEETARLALDTAKLLKLIGDERDRQGPEDAYDRHRLSKVYQDLTMNMVHLSDWLSLETFCLVSNYHEVKMGPRFDNDSPKSETVEKGSAA